MPFWKRLLKVAALTEATLDALKYRLGKRLKLDTDVTILAYIGQGTSTQLSLRGRVVQNRKVKSATDDDSVWRNLLNMYRRLETDEIPSAKVTAIFGDNEQEVIADAEGYFNVLFELDAPLQASSIWQEITLRYDDGERQAETIGQVMIPPDDAKFGVISDLDDTVLRTDVTNLLKLVRNTFLRNARTRLPFVGVAEFYRALQNSGDTFNPIFYVSNSPYNLYDLIDDFFKIQRIPKGPIYLRDMGLTEDYLLASHQHKFERVEKLLRLYPDLRFILVGDSGEKDAAIYLEIVQKYPDQILVVYIRDVEPQKPDSKRDNKVLALASAYQALGVDLVLVTDTTRAARHAVENGWLDASALDKIPR